jgi:hypothetical protein
VRDRSADRLSARSGKVLASQVGCDLLSRSHITQSQTRPASQPLPQRDQRLTGSNAAQPPSKRLSPFRPS